MLQANRSMLALALSLALLGGCAEKTADKPAPSQVLARVNDTEITVHQLNYLARSQPGGKVDEATRQKLLEQLVDQEVLVQQAVAQKLDREPNVLQALEAARRQILAQAAAEKVLAVNTTPTAAAMDQFYREHPALFAERKIFGFEAFQVSADAVNDTVRGKLDKIKSVAEMQAVMQEAGIRYQQRSVRLAAEQLPMPLLERMADIKPGDVLAVPEDKQLVLMLLRDSEAVPVTRQDADAQIKQYLQRQELERTAQNKLVALRKAANIEYVARHQAAVGQKDNTEPAPVTPAAKPASPAAAKAGLSAESAVEGLK